jgi:hypothetical protein
MKADWLSEPELDFGDDGRHVDIRFGLMNYGPLDVLSEFAPKRIPLGIVGTPESVEGLCEWLELCKQPIAAKGKTRLYNLFPLFPGFRPDTAFQSDLVVGAESIRTIPADRFDSLLKKSPYNEVVSTAVRLFVEEFRFLCEQSDPKVLLCAVPAQIARLMDPLQRPAHDARQPLFDFHDMLKAEAMGLGRSVQLVLPSTYDPTQRRKLKIRADTVRSIQDDATRAWNLHTAIYYKAGGYPWRLVREAEKLSTCYVGISFYLSLDRSEISTSMAQVFDERGEGMVIRGAPLVYAKDDRVPHMTGETAKNLMAAALDQYRLTHSHYPARIVAHKTSQFTQEELEGMQSALSDARVDWHDFLSLERESNTRLFRVGKYPPLRGTVLAIDDRNHLLYTRGSVAFYETYPGMYVPRPVHFRTEKIQQTPRILARETLALTKMNWNVTQFDGSRPITTVAARRVGKILKYLPEGVRHAAQYRFYM